jgi:hypothetical protein
MEQNQHHNRRHLWRIVFIVVVCIALAIGMPFYITAQRRAMERTVWENTFFVEFVLDIWAGDHGFQYPLILEAIVEDGYIDEMPINPFTHRPTRVIAFGDKPFEGEMSYAPIVEKGEVWHYDLTCYGSDANPGLDKNGDGVPDHVLYYGEGEELKGSKEDFARLKPPHNIVYW